MARHAKTNIEFSEIDKDGLIQELKIIAEEMHGDVGKFSKGEMYLPRFLIDAVMWCNDTPDIIKAVSFDLDGKPEIIATVDSRKNPIEANSLERSCVYAKKLADCYEGKLGYKNNIRNLSMQYFDALSKNTVKEKGVFDLEDSMCNAVCKIQNGLISEALFNKVEREFTEQVLNYMGYKFELVDQLEKILEVMIDRSMERDESISGWYVGDIYKKTRLSEYYIAQKTVEDFLKICEGVENDYGTDAAITIMSESIKKLDFYEGESQDMKLFVECVAKESSYETPLVKTKKLKP